MKYYPMEGFSGTQAYGLDPKKYILFLKRTRASTRLPSFMRFLYEGYVCYYPERDEDITNVNDDPPMPNKNIVRIAATGNHFLSVRKNPIIKTGAVKIVSGIRISVKDPKKTQAYIRK